ncbi:microfibrillar-associated protein 1-like [Pollicipes pollicipes]|uniref:microfibrillar-associated protein 1-like n=1 Tax=Pollicipes pollicipes TaxID=41117 RepID=UPI001884B9EC|nr:microfibrillar-associated protein 1-like [Pollicipes pollicipes]
MDNPSKIGIQINSTAGAIPIRNEKGQVYMQKVKVQRYVTGKRPDYAPSSDEEFGSDDEFVANQQQPAPGEELELTEQERDDPRLRRLQRLQQQEQQQQQQQQQEEAAHDSDGSDTAPRRRVHAPEVLEDSDDGEEDLQRRRRQSSDEESDSGDSEEDLDDDEIVKKREMLRERAMAKAKREEELMEVEEEKKSEDEEEEEEDSSEYEEYTDSEEETGPRLKPVFVRKQDRITVQEKERQAVKQKQAELEARKMAEERRRDTLKMVESDIRKEQQTSVDVDPSFAIDTDDENDEADYELWKLRELKRIKRDKEEREALERERLELERLRNMTEEERRAEARNNPKQITNKAAKGKYKFLQKYYHRGAFFMDREEGVYRRDFSGTTLEDRFDKTVLPKVMQVKNFGRSGRTKYTHLVEQDTTSFDSAWAVETAQNAKFFNVQAGGVKQIFEKPSLKKKRTKP